MERRKFIKGTILAGLGLLVPLPKAKATSVVLGSSYVDVTRGFGVDNLDGHHAHELLSGMADDNPVAWMDGHHTNKFQEA